jgi:hypothetical protein
MIFLKLQEMVMIELENGQLMNEEETPAMVSGDAEEPKKKEKEPHSKVFEEFLAQMTIQATAEAKLQLAIEMMRSSISQGGSPNFKHFWEARKLCLPLFKENIPQPVRSPLWDLYVELSKEARRLKEILDEQSAFAVEQIEMAIAALEKEIASLKEHVEPAHALLIPQAFEAHEKYYRGVQGELNVLNAEASRINALRKELIKTDMRVRQKNNLFQRLSSVGDHVFPRRKDLIKEVSTRFVQDTDDFVKRYFGQEIPSDLLFYLRDQIKILQGMAKELTLNTTSFTKTRHQLSECWDKLKVEEKEFKKERAQQRVAFKQNADALMEKIKECQVAFAEGHLTINDAQGYLDEVVSAMRQTELGRDEVKFLRDEVSAVRHNVEAKIKEEDDRRLSHEKERDQKKKEMIKNLKERIQGLLKGQEQFDAEHLSSEREVLLVEIQQTGVTKLERQELEKLLKPLKDMITEKKEKSVLSLSADDKASLEKFQAVLNQRLARRQEIKNQLEIFRKAAGSSGFDFEKAMNDQAQIEEEKERLEKINQGIKEIQDKISGLASK